MPTLENHQHELFAQRVAAGGFATAAYIAAGYSAKGADTSSSRLLRRPDVRARVRELKAEIAAKLIDCAVKDKNMRLEAWQRVWDKLHAVIEERAADKSLDHVPGGGTGLIVRTKAAARAGWDGDEVYAVDTGTLDALLAVGERAARECGQWAPEKIELSGSVGLVERLNAARKRTQAQV